MRNREFKLSRPLSRLLRRIAGEDMVDSIGEDLEDRFRQEAENSGFTKARIKVGLHLISLILSFIGESLIWRAALLRGYLKVAFRQLTRQKGYSFITIMGLTVGMAGFILIGLWVRDEMSFDRFHQKKDRIYRILNRLENGDFIASPTYALAPTLKEIYPEVEEFSRVWFQYGSLVKHGERSFEEDRIFLADPGFFRMFTFPFVRGNPETALDARNAIVITADTALRYFGEEDAIGKVLHMTRHNTDFTVTGVIENLPANSHMQFDLITRVELLGEDRLARWEEWTGPCYILLRPEVSAAAFEKRIEDIYREYESPTATYSPALQPLVKVHLYERGKPGSVKKVGIFSLVAIFILIIACINFMNMSTARSARRSKEVGVRKVIGAVRSQITRQFLGEALVVTFISLILALVLVEATLPAFNHFTGKSLTLLTKANIRLILTLLFIALGTGLLAGSYPAFFLSSFLPANTLKNRQRTGTRGSSIRKALIVFQFTISAALIICTLVVSRQMRYIQARDLGINRDNVVILLNNPVLGQRYESFHDTLRNKPGIRYVTAAAQGPTWIGESISIDWTGNPSEDSLSIDYTVVDYDFFKTFEMQTLKGRTFSREHPTDMKNACVITEMTARRIGKDDPIGMTITMNHPAWPASFRKATVIGVVKDFHSRTLHSAVRPFVFRMYRPWHSYIFIKIDGERIPAALEEIAASFKTTVPGYPFRYMFYDEAFNRQYAPERQLGQLFNGFSLLSIFISCLGLFGLAAYTVEQKTKEIGIRKVLGASLPGITLLTAREFLKGILFSNLFAWPAAYFVTSHWLRDFAYKIRIGPAVFLLAAGLTVVIAFLTVGFQSLKAALANPVDSLRYE